MVKLEENKEEITQSTLFSITNKNKGKAFVYDNATTQIQTSTIFN